MPLNLTCHRLYIVAYFWQQAEEVADVLVKQGFDAQSFHAGMKSEVKKQVQDEFMASEKQIVRLRPCFIPHLLIHGST